MLFLDQKRDFLRGWVELKNTFSVKEQCYRVFLFLLDFSFDVKTIFDLHCSSFNTRSNPIFAHPEEAAAALCALEGVS